MPNLSDTSYLFRLQFCLSTVPRYATLVVCIALPRRISDSTLQSRLRYASSAVNPRGGIKQSLKFNTQISTEELIILPRLSHTHADKVFLDKFNSPVSLKQRQIRKWLAYHRHTTEFLFYYIETGKSGMDTSCLGCYVVSMGKWYPVFQRLMVPSSAMVMQS